MSILPVIGSIISSVSQHRANKANSAQAQRQMDFQERMSNTSHQREVQDLRAAGLNPILSANGGASTPSGSMAQMSPTVKDDLSRSISSAKSLKLQREALASQVALQIEQSRLANAQTLTQSYDQELKRNQTQQQSAQALVNISQAKMNSAQTAKINAETALQIARLPGERLKSDAFEALGSIIGDMGHGFEFVPFLGKPIARAADLLQKNLHERKKNARMGRY